MYYINLRFRMTLSTTDRTHGTEEGTCLSLLLRKFVKGLPNLFNKVIEVSRPIEFVNQDGKSW